MTSSYTILPATAADIPALYELQLLAFETEAEMIGSRDVPALQESPEAHRADFANWTTLKLVGPDGDLLGAIRYRPAGEVMDVGRLMTHPSCRRMGLAQKLLAEVAQICPRDTLELYTCTLSWTNIRLYEKMGYRAVREVTEDSGLSFVYMRKSPELSIS